MNAHDRQTRDALAKMLPQLRRFARTLAHQPADADELLQKALERALTRLHQFEPGTRLDSWMYRIMKNIWIDEIRSKSRRDAVFAPEEAGRYIGARDPHLDGRVDMMAVEQAMAALPDEQRLAVSLVLIQGLSYKEAAAVMGVPMGTLTSRLARGRDALAVQLEDGA